MEENHKREPGLMSSSSSSAMDTTFPDNVLMMNQASSFSTLLETSAFGSYVHHHQPEDITNKSNTSNYNSPVGFMDLLGVQDYAYAIPTPSMFDCLPPITTTTTTAVTSVVPSPASSAGVLNTPASPNSLSLSSSSNNAAVEEEQQSSKAEEEDVEEDGGVRGDGQDEQDKSNKEQ